MGQDHGVTSRQIITPRKPLQASVRSRKEQVARSQRTSRSNRGTHRSNSKKDELASGHQGLTNMAPKRSLFYQKNQSEAILKRFHDIIQTENPMLKRDQSSKNNGFNQSGKGGLKIGQLAKLSMDENAQTKNPGPNSHSALDLFTKTLTESERINNKAPSFLAGTNEKPAEAMSALDRFTRLPQNQRPARSILDNSRNSVRYPGVNPVINKTAYGQAKHSRVLPHMPSAHALITVD